MEPSDQESSNEALASRSSNRESGLRILAALALVVGAVSFWSYAIDRRPIHADEAVNAVQSTRYLENGEYRYEPTAYHGPALVLLVRFAAWVTPGDADALDVAFFRRLSVGMGAITLLLLTLLVNRRGAFTWGSIGVSGLFIASSPTVGFYLRTFIHEPILVVGIVGSLAALVWRLEGTRPGLKSAALLGVSWGILVATKETWVLVLAAGAIAWLGTAALVRIARTEASPSKPSTPWPWLGWTTGIAGVITALVYQTGQSSPVDVVRSFAPYLELGTTAGDHVKPWIYYAQQLGGWDTRRPLLVTELPLIVWFFIGIGLLFLRWNRRVDSNRLVGVTTVAIYAITLFVISSSIPYKTPWLVLPFWVPALLVAGWGFREVAQRVPRAGGVLLLLLTVGPMVYTSTLTSIRYPSHPRNPLAYAQPSRDVERLASYLGQLAVLPGESGRPKPRFEVHVVGTHPWPLPWTLRDFPHVGYWESSDSYRAALASSEVSSSDSRPAVLILIRRSGDTGSELQPHESSLSFHYGLRPGTTAQVWVDPEWQRRFQEHHRGR